MQGPGAGLKHELVSCPGNKRANPFDFGKDGSDSRDPDEGVGLRTVLVHEGVDPEGQFLDVGERAAADGLLRDQPEPALNLMDSGGVGGGVVHVVAGPASQPGVDPGMLVGGVVVDNEMDVERRGHVGVDAAQEGEELLVPMALFALREYVAGAHVESGGQRRRAAADRAEVRRAVLQCRVRGSGDAICRRSCCSGPSVWRWRRSTRPGRSRARSGIAARPHAAVSGSGRS